jgi:polyphosphate kinase
VLLHHPFQSFAPVMDLLRQAAADPNVLAIKQTLYRTGDIRRSSMRWWRRRTPARTSPSSSNCARASMRKPTSSCRPLQEAGAHVMYGVVGYKTHAKLMLIVRREAAGHPPLLHLGTGNYHPRTARVYTDYGLFTCDEDIGTDVHEIFLQLTSLTQTPKLRRLLQSPFKLHESLLALIEREKSRTRAPASPRASSPS